MLPSAAVAIYNRVAGIETLTGFALSWQAKIATLLATDPATGKPFISWANTAQSQEATPPLQYPHVTYRSCSGSIDRRFAIGLAVENSALDFEIWDNSTDNSRILLIDRCLTNLFDQRLDAPGLPLTDGISFCMDKVVPMQTMYDQLKHVWFAIIRYRIVQGEQPSSAP